MSALLLSATFTRFFFFPLHDALQMSGRLEPFFIRQFLRKAMPPCSLFKESATYNWGWGGSV